MSRIHSLLSTVALMTVVGCGIQSTEQVSSATGEHVEVSASEFRQAIAEPGIVLAKFGAPWCGPCREVDAELDKLEASKPSQLTIVRVNVDEEPGLAEEYEISAIPVILLFKNGEQVQEWLGFQEAAEFQAKIDELN